MAKPEKTTEVAADTDLLAKLVKWYKDFEDITRDARKLAEKDRDFYDGKQWATDEIQKLKERNQPVVTYNRIAPKINYLRGYEMKTRVDPRAFPRTPAHEDAAIACTDGMRYVADVERFDRHRSDVAEHLLIEGYGGVIIEPEVVERPKPLSYSSSAAPIPGGVAENSTMTAEVTQEVEIRIRKVPWDRVFYDPHSREYDFSDAKYVGIVQWWHLDDARAEYPDEEAQTAIDGAVVRSSGFDETFEDRPHNDIAKTYPPRVQIFEIYWREGGCWYTAHYTKADFLVRPTKLTLVDERGNSYCPMILTSAYVDRENARYGAVRAMISAQEEINKRRSKALHLLTFRQVIYETGAFDDPSAVNVLFAKPDGMIEVSRGTLAEKRMEIANTTDMLQGQLQLLQDAKLEVDATGPEAPLVGEDRRVQSGKALQFRQQAGAMQLEPVFDHLREWQTAVFRVIWWMIRQFWTEERWVRVTDDLQRRGFRFVALNRPMPRIQRLADLLKKEVPVEQAMDMLGLPFVYWSGVLQRSQQIVQTQIQQMQQMAAMQQQQMAAAGGMPVQPQPPPQIPPQQLVQMLLSVMANEPLMREVILENDIGQLDCDIVIDASPDTTVVQQEEFANLVEIAQAQPGSVPPAVIIQASQLRNKRELLAMLEQKPDPAAEQAKQLGLMQMQADIEKTKAQAMDEQASAQQRLADAGSKSADAPLKQAQAMEHAAKAGERTSPIGGFR